MAKLSLIQYVLWSQHHHSTSLTVTEPLVHLLATKTSSRWRYKRSTPGALPLATTVKCEFVAHVTSLLRSEQLARAASAADGSAAAEKEGATGEPDGVRHNNELIFSWANVSCFCHECAAFRFKSARRVQAGQHCADRPAGRRQENAVAHSMYSDVRLCARMCPLIQDKKSAVQSKNRHVLRIYEDILYLKISYWDIRTCTELHGQKLYSVYTEIYFWPKVYLEIYWVYTEINDFLDFHTEFYGSIVELMMYVGHLSIYRYILIWARWSGFQMSKVATAEIASVFADICTPWPNIFSSCKSLLDCISATLPDKSVTEFFNSFKFWDMSYAFPDKSNILLIIFSDKSNILFNIYYIFW
jgi:hypothetical protein